MRLSLVSDESVGADTDSSVGQKRSHPLTPLALSFGPETETELTINARKLKVAPPPCTAVVIISVSPEAAAKGVTNAKVLEKAQQGVDLSQLGITGVLLVRMAATGARLLELPASVGTEVADRLAERLRQVLDGLATVIRPAKTAEVRSTAWTTRPPKRRWPRQLRVRATALKPQSGTVRPTRGRVV